MRYALLRYNKKYACNFSAVIMIKGAYVILVLWL